MEFDRVREAIRSIIPRPDYDDGSIGPILVRLAWHACGTYDKVTDSGGSEGATMRFAPESEDEANAGLHVARSFLEPIKTAFPWISYGDLWTLAGAEAIEAMGGPKIVWRPGRVDLSLESVKFHQIPPNGRLPDASKDQNHLRQVFGRMGFNDREIVALSGAHSLGRCHTDRSGYSGPWTHQPTRFTNQYFSLLSALSWSEKFWDGPMQYSNGNGTLMMLPTDIVLIKDPIFKRVVSEYAEDEKLFFADFALAFAKLLELGVKRAKM